MLFEKPLDHAKILSNYGAHAFNIKGYHFSSPKTQEHKPTRVAGAALEQQEGMVLIKYFHVNKREVIQHAFEPSTLRIAVLHLTKCATTIRNNIF